MTEHISLDNILNSPGSPMGNGSSNLSGFTIGDSTKSPNKHIHTTPNAMTSASSVSPEKTDDISHAFPAGAPDCSPPPSVLASVRVLPEDNTSKNLNVVQAEPVKDDPQVEQQMSAQGAEARQVVITVTTFTNSRNNFARNTHVTVPGPHTYTSAGHFSWDHHYISWEHAQTSESAWGGTLPTSQMCQPYIRAILCTGEILAGAGCARHLPTICFQPAPGLPPATRHHVHVLRQSEECRRPT